MQWRGDAMNHSFAHCTVVGAGQVDANRDSLRPSMECGGDRTEALCEHRTCAAMKQSVRLGVPRHWHAPGDSSWHDIGDLDTHALVQAARVATVEEGSELFEVHTVRG